LEIAVWIYRAVAAVSKDVKLTDKLLKKPNKERQNPAKNYCGRRGRGVAETKYHDLLPYFFT